MKWLSGCESGGVDYKLQSFCITLPFQSQNGPFRPSIEDYKSKFEESKDKVPVAMSNRLLTCVAVQLHMCVCMPVST